MYRFFERLLDPFPTTTGEAPPRTLWAFLWFYSNDAAPWLALMALFAAAIAVGEVYLFSFLGQIVDWLATAAPRGSTRGNGVKYLALI